MKLLSHRKGSTVIGVSWLQARKKLFEGISGSPRSPFTYPAILILPLLLPHAGHSIYLPSYETGQ